LANNKGIPGREDKLLLERIRIWTKAIVNIKEIKGNLIFLKDIRRLALTFGKGILNIKIEIKHTTKNKTPGEYKGEKE
tara:strand:- start:48 stop:281 length:234 start_codon:yes stop_codon:yes gene_type:complete